MFLLMVLSMRAGGWSNQHTYRLDVEVPPGAARFFSVIPDDTHSGPWPSAAVHASNNTNASLPPVIHFYGRTSQCAGVTDRHAAVYNSSTVHMTVSCIGANCVLQPLPLTASNAYRTIVVHADCCSVAPAGDGLAFINPLFGLGLYYAFVLVAFLVCLAPPYGLCTDVLKGVFLFSLAYAGIFVIFVPIFV